MINYLFGYEICEIMDVQQFPHFVKYMLFKEHDSSLGYNLVLSIVWRLDVYYVHMCLYTLIFIACGYYIFYVLEFIDDIFRNYSC
jgi:hypothetical protein